MKKNSICTYAKINISMKKNQGSVINTLIKKKIYKYAIYISDDMVNHHCHWKNQYTSSQSYTYNIYTSIIVVYFVNLYILTCKYLLTPPSSTAEVLSLGV